MHSLPRTRLLYGLLAGALALGAAPRPAAAQGKADDAEKVRFETVDGVELHGNFYKGKKTMPTVLLLHAVGASEDSRKKEWDDLAKALVAHGYSVLGFDFRGHGSSTKVDPEEFWKAKYLNTKLVYGAAKKASSIDVKGFSKPYYPVLVNDIAAARAFLDDRNDRGECNSANLVVVGAQSGGALGALWMHSEWHRYKLLEPTDFGKLNLKVGLQLPPPLYPGNLMPQVDEQPLGKDVVAGIFLSLTSNFGSPTDAVSVSRLLDLPGRQKKVPMLLIYGEKDVKGREVALVVEKNLKTGKEPQEFSGAMKLQGSEKLAGRDLLQNDLGVADFIHKQIKRVVDRKQNATRDVNFVPSAYLWKMTAANPALMPPWRPAKAGGQRALVYMSYREFLPK